MNGLTIEKLRSNAWKIKHEPSGLDVNSRPYKRKRDALAAIKRLEPLGIDWTLSRDELTPIITPLLAEITELLLSDEDRALREIAAARATRLIRALEDDGAERVVERKSHGLAGTSYHMTCGCIRGYHVSLYGDEQESLRPCERHEGLEAKVCNEWLQMGLGK